MPSRASTCLLMEDDQLDQLTSTVGGGERQHRCGNRSRNSNKKLYRLVVMGSSRVGKTALINRFMYHAFVTNHKPTVEEMHRAEYHALVLDVLDTSGTYSFPAMRALSIEKADGFVLVYAIDDVQSFEEVRALREQIIEGRPSSANAPIPPIVVVANKDDLRNECKEDIAANSLLVHRETAETTVCIDWENDFVESSAKQNHNVDRIFQELLSKVIGSRQYSSSPDLERRYSCPPTLQRTSDGVSQECTGMRHLFKRHSCTIA